MSATRGQAPKRDFVEVRHGKWIAAAQVRREARAAAPHDKHDLEADSFPAAAAHLRLAARTTTEGARR
jgi:hypothetical protein